jgi:hypothetical protein
MSSNYSVVGGQQFRESPYYQPSGDDLMT